MKLQQIRKYKAFTLWEMLVVLVLLSVLVTFSYAVYRQFATSLLGDQEQIEEVVDMLGLEHVLRKHLESCDYIEKDPTGLYFVYPDREYCLVFLDSVVELDLWENASRVLKIDGWDCTTIGEEDRYVRSFRIRISALYEGADLNFQKQYSRKFLYAHKTR